MPAQRKTNQSRRLTGAGLIAVTAATLLMMVWVIFPTAAFAVTKPISVSSGSLSAHGCDNSEWHFVINQLADFNGDGKINEADAPASIHVTWASLDSADVPLDGVNGHEASYTTTANLDSTVTGATAIIDSSWSGQFVLSHGPCEQARIEIEKQTVPNGDPATFGFTGEINTTLGDGQSDGKDVEPGTYTVSETALAGWTLTDITCNDTNSTDAGSTATFRVEEGETVRCVFTNTKNATTTTPGGGGGGGGGVTTTTTTTTAATTTTTYPTVAPTTIHNTSTTPTNEVLPTTVRPGGTAFTGVENVVPIGAIALMLMTSSSGLLWAGTRRRRHDGSEDED